jgi:hypothetical protein
MGGDLDTRIAALKPGRYFRTITIGSDPDMRFTDGDYIDEGTEVEVYCLVSHNELDERRGKVVAVADEREVEISAELVDLVKAQLAWVPDAAAEYCERMNL